MGNKINIFTGRQSKIKNGSCFLPVHFDLELTLLLEICVCKSFGAEFVFRNIGTQTLGRSIFYWVMSGFPFNSNIDVTQRSGHIFVGRAIFVKQVKADFSNVCYTLFLLKLSILWWNILETNVDLWSGNSKDTKSGKTKIFCFNHVYGSLNHWALPTEAEFISYHIISNFISISYIKTNKHKKHNMILRTWFKGQEGLRQSRP